MDTFQEKMVAWIANIRVDQKERTVRQEVMEANPEKEEPTSDDMESKAEHWEIPTEHAMVKTGKSAK
jgi:hypothetical protein